MPTWTKADTMDQQTEQLLLGYIEGELDEEQRWQAEALLTQRPELAKWVRAMRDDREAIRTMPTADVPEAVTDAIESLREREALLGPVQGGRRASRDRGTRKTEPAVAGRIAPSGVEAGGRSLSTRRWGVRLAVAAAILLCAGVMLEAIVGTNLLIPTREDAEAVDALAMEARGSERQRDQAVDAETPADDSVPTDPPARDFDESAGPPAAEMASSLVEAQDPLDPPAAAVPPATQLSEVAEAIASSTMETPAAPEDQASLQPSSAALAIADTDASDIDEPTDDNESAPAVTPAAAADPPSQAAAGPEIRLEVGANNQALAFVAVQDWALANNIALVTAADEPAVEPIRPTRGASGSPDRFADPSLAKAITAARIQASENLVSRSSRAAEPDAAAAEAVQVVQLAVPEAQVAPLVAHIEGQGGNAVRLLGTDSPAAARQPMALDEHPQVQWVPPPADATPRSEAAADQAGPPQPGALTRSRDIAGEDTADQVSSQTPAATAMESAEEAKPAHRLAGVDLFALMRSRAPRTPTQPLSEIMPDRPVLVELLIRQNAVLIPEPPAPAEDTPQPQTP
ncbi:MAG: hypothetical protein AAF823_08495 [Planctomycetota bacterium]